MKRLLFISLLLISISASSQYRVIDWKTQVLNVVMLTDSTFQFDAMPYDYNDPGAATREMGNYFVDFGENRFKIIASDATTITVVNQYYTNTAPLSSQPGHVYQSVGNGAAEYIGGVDNNTADVGSRFKTVAADNELMWRAIAEVSDTNVVKYADSTVVFVTPTQLNEAIPEQPLQSVYTISLPNTVSVQLRCDGATETTDYPTGWVISSGTNAVDLKITHSLGRKVALVTVWSVDGVAERQLYGNAAYSGILAETDQILIIESLATISKPIVVEIIFANE